MVWIFHKKYLVWMIKALALYGILTFIYIETRILAKRGHNIELGSIKFGVTFIEDGKGLDSGSDSSVSTCPVNGIGGNKSVIKETDNDAMKCKQHLPSKAACSFARDFFAYDFNKWSCGSEEKLQICKFLPGRKTYECDYSKCGFFLKKKIFIHLFDARYGKVRSLKKGFEDSESLSENVMKFGKATLSNGFPFMFVSCGLKDPKKSQLLVLDPSMINQKSPKHDDKSSDKINLNLLFLDSISRAHFYRSLKQTVSYFSWLNEDSKQAEVLDFQLFQSIHGHTTENILGLMTGKTLPNTTTDSEREEAKTEFPQMLEYLVKHGYKTLYQEDECWKGFWGMNSDLGLFKKWHKLYKKIKTKSFIGDLGLTLASCKIIDMYAPQLNHVFNTEDKICYNGLNMDTYFLRYLSNKISKTKSPLFSFTALNIAHDPAGKRVQGIDLDLKDFVKVASRLPNTLTIIFSDHGNTYSDYVYTDIEGRYEMFHPTLFLVIPNGVQQKLGHQIMHNMRKNQNRLLNLIDIHHTIKHIVDQNHPNKGILQVLSSNRTCADIPMAMPNLCVCDGWDSPVDNTTELMPFVEFAIGHINNIISNASPNMKCKRLVPTSFQNVMQRKNGDDAILKFDIITLSGPGSKNNEERISVEVSHKVSESLRHFDTKLVSHDRLSKFGEYRSCSDAETKFRYCVCNMKKPDVTEKLKVFGDLSPVRNDYVYEIFNGKVDENVRYVIKKKVGLVIRKTVDDEKNLVTVTFEAISKADVSNSYEITVKFTDLENIKPLTNKVCQGILRPNSMVYLCTLARKFSVWSARFSHKVSYRRV